MNKELTWREIKAFKELYTTGRTTSRIEQNPYVDFLFRNRMIAYKGRSKNIIIANPRFKREYEKEQFDLLYDRYYPFLEKYDLLSPHKNYTEFEINCLMEMSVSPFLDEIAENIREGKESRNGVSGKFFKAGKHIKRNSALESAVLKIIGVDRFPENDNQGFYRVPCPSPQCIILCENFKFLKLDIARMYSVELWYTGGNNTAPIERLDKIDYPIYYLCDWDYDGLKIYERLHEIIQNQPNKVTDLQLITPNGLPVSLEETKEHHSSQWLSGQEFSGLTNQLYTPSQQQLIQTLIEKDEWIEEETNSLVRVIEEVLGDSF
ncbi:MAG: hypothetical protein LIP06_06685 [Tannerellaceae bacterium]|nr:hypothetical protein [Tannerellaceae bacterium]